MIALGALVIVYGLVIYVLNERDLKVGRYKSRYTINSIFAGLILIIAVLLALLII